MERRRRWWWWRWAAVAVVVLVTATPTRADWEDCPPGCKCTYASNRKMADCSEAGFSTAPLTLSTEIQELNLHGNNIVYLEKDAFSKAGLVNLQKLYLQDNQIRSLHKDAFRGLKIMIDLNLSNNKIDKLHPDTFTGLEKLRFLDLSMNLLSRLNGVQFPPLPHLRKLNFRENRLTYIHNFAFSNLKILESLRLSGNQLKLIQPELFTNNTKLVELELHDNQWECDCHLKSLVRWTKTKKLLQTHVTCHTPQRMSGRKWEEVREEELACRPELEVTHVEVPAAPGQNATLTCNVRGDPLPQVRWVLNGRVLTNMSVVRFSTPEQIYLVREELGERPHERVTSLTVTHVTQDDLTYYTCVAENLAGLVEHNVSLVPAETVTTGAMTPPAGPDLYLIIGVVAGGVLLLLLVCICICLCVRRRRRRTTKPKVNGTAGATHTRHENVMIVNPVEKPPRRYEKVPQTDLEMSSLGGAVSGGGHRSYDEVDYPPEAAPANLRTPLATLEEEDDDPQSHNTTLEAVTGPHASAEYWAHYPDIVDMTRPRATSPLALTHHSYRSPVGPGEWRYSYAHPAHYPGTDYYSSGYVSPPGIPPRPGYVTLPRRHRSPSWAGPPSAEMAVPPPAPASECGDSRPVYDPIYDTLGPRTTADGTSRTDLTRPALRAAEPFSPRTPQSPPMSPPTPSLPPYYAPLTSTHNPASEPHSSAKSRLISTLPRSTPNLLDGSGISGLSLPAHESTAVSTPRRLPYSTPRTIHPSPPSSTSSPFRTSSPLQLNGKSGTPPTATTSADSILDTSISSSNNNNNNSINNNNSKGGGGGKKVPPKPPPKPLGKRLSTSSIPGDGKKSGESGKVFQDEGPDGTEV